VGVIPRALVDREIAHAGLSELHVVETMHERKARMAELSDAFLALPGGLGTLEELFEIWTWGMLGLHHKPYGVLDVDGYYQPLIKFLDHARDEGFVRPSQRDRLVVDTDAERLLAALARAGGERISKATSLL
ncbi:MAG TPA: TIGR00730 family Rossman fold protein, partial [Gemmatimonadaceae bacterium]|nr:TIGR00730 family Rossman fold protein [Gemmatimonadaceae bacterium]